MPTTIPTRTPAKRQTSSFDPGALAAALMFCLMVAGALSPAARASAAADTTTLDQTEIAAMQGGL